MESRDEASQDGGAWGEGSRPLGRRNLPRASHACQSCRLKKARCDQRKPCSNCVKHSFDCIFTAKRSIGTAKEPSNSSPVRHHNKSAHDLLRTSVVTDPALSVASGHGSEFQNPSSSDSSDEQDIGASNGNVPQRLDSELREEMTGQDPDMVGDINNHTSGTEFYGTSSNFVLLNQLFSRAQLRMSNENGGSISPTADPPTSSTIFSNQDNMLLGNEPSPQSVGRSSITRSSPQLQLGPGKPSIINLLYNEEVLLPPSRSRTPVAATNRASDLPGSQSSMEIRSSDGTHDGGKRRRRTSRRGSLGESLLTQTNTAGRNNTRQVKEVSEMTVQRAEKRLEKEYVRIFFHNLHYIHPLLDAAQFMVRCEEEIWNSSTSDKPVKDSRHFYALYNIVVAVGALIAPTYVSQQFERELIVCAQHLPNPSQVISSPKLSKIYFWKARSLLGDVFEVCSIESAQTHLLMSLYCQNSLKPHACYMYSGMAVRIALAIGLPHESMSRSPEARKAARRTWWCIYSHEIDMCCSSGRRDSLRKPRNYQIPMPQIKDRSLESTNVSELEDHSVSMINEMVHFGFLLRRISKEIYHDSTGLSMAQKSETAIELDELLERWKSRLPEWLNLDSVSIREPEWASKQKVVLQLRYLNARILLHRPFLALSSSNELIALEKHVEPCLYAARETIRILYDSFANRHYFRTWWYNSTYTLYAGMIVLYVILLDRTKRSGEELLCDVKKSREILLSMEEASVARRSADLIGEVLEVAKTSLQQQQGQVDTVGEPRTSFNGSGVFEGQLETQEPLRAVDDDISWTLFARPNSMQNRGELLAPLIDPTALEDFANGPNNSSAMDLSAYYMGTFMENATEDLGFSMGYRRNSDYGNYMYGNHGLV